MGNFITSIFRVIFNFDMFPFARVSNQDVSGFWRDYGLWIIGGVIVVAVLNTLAIIFGVEGLFSVSYRGSAS